MIGIIGAMALEISLLKSQLQQAEQETVSGIVFSRGKLCGHPVVLAQSGVGKVFAAVCAQTMILRYGVDFLVNSGVAGSLSETLRIGDVVIGTACVQHDMDTSPVGDPVGMVSGINCIQFPADAAAVKELRSVCEKLQIPNLPGIIATGDQFVASKERARWIAETFGAAAAEMESGAIAQTALINKCPFAVIRVISDGVNGQSIEDYPAFVRESAKTSSEIVLSWLEAFVR